MFKVNLRLKMLSHPAKKNSFYLKCITCDKAIVYSCMPLNKKIKFSHFKITLCVENVFCNTILVLFRAFFLQYLENIKYNPIIIP